MDLPGNYLHYISTALWLILCQAIQNGDQTRVFCETWKRCRPMHNKIKLNKTE